MVRYLVLASVIFVGCGDIDKPTTLGSYNDPSDDSGLPTTETEDDDPYDTPPADDTAPTDADDPADGPSTDTARPADDSGAIPTPEYDTASTEDTARADDTARGDDTALGDDTAEDAADAAAGTIDIDTAGTEIARRRIAAPSSVGRESFTCVS